MVVIITESIQLGVFRTRDITLATSLMMSDYPGINLYDVLVEEHWPEDAKPRCEFVLTVDDPALLQSLLEQYMSSDPRGLPISNSGEYDRHKARLVDAMRRARARANRKRRST